MRLDNFTFERRDDDKPQGGNHVTVRASAELNWASRLQGCPSAHFTRARLYRVTTRD